MTNLTPGNLSNTPFTQRPSACRWTSWPKDNGAVNSAGRPSQSFLFWPGVGVRGCIYTTVSNSSTAAQNGSYSGWSYIIIVSPSGPADWKSLILEEKGLVIVGLDGMDQSVGNMQGGRRVWKGGVHCSFETEVFDCATEFLCRLFWIVHTYTGESGESFGVLFTLFGHVVICFSCQRFCLVFLMQALWTRRRQ